MTEIVEAFMARQRAGDHGGVADPAAISGEAISGEAISRAAALLAGGSVVGLPTDTVYGLAASPFSRHGTEALFALKGRPTSVELPVLVADRDQALMLCRDLSRSAVALMDRFWPGALTIVVARRGGLGLDLGGDGTTVGLRCANHPVAIALCRRAGPLATTSANRHGFAPATTAQSVAEMEGVALVLDAGPCVAVASTVVSCLTSVPVLLRAGAVAWEDVVAEGS